MSVLTTDPLAPLALLSVQFTLAPFLTALWWHNRSKTGWAVSFAFWSLWQWAVRYGAGLDNVLTELTPGVDADQGKYLYNVVFPWLILVSALCGTLFAESVGLVYLLQVEMIVPIGPGETIDSGIASNPDELVMLRQDIAVQSGSITAYGLQYVPRPYGHFVGTFILFACAIAAPFATFEQLWATNASAALWTGILELVLTFIAALLFWRYVTAIAAFGPDEANMKQRETQLTMLRKEDDGEGRGVAGEPDLSDETLRKAVYERTHYRVYKTVLLMAGVHLTFFLLLCGVATYSNPANVNVMWILGLCLMLGFTIVVAIIAFGYSAYINRQRKQQAYAATIGGGSSGIPDTLQRGGSSNSGYSKNDEEEIDEGGSNYEDIQSRIRMNRRGLLSVPHNNK